MEGEILFSNIESEELFTVELMEDNQCLHKIGGSLTVEHTAFSLGVGEYIN